MHLCEPCAASRDWAADPVVRTKIALNLQQTDENRKARCVDCSVLIRNPMFRCCAKCAAKAGLCQFCSGPTGATEALQDALDFETLFDAYVTLVKTYGVRTARCLLSAAALEPHEAPHVATLVELDVGLVDSHQPHQRYHYRLKRPIWTNVWGQLGFDCRPPRCGDCAPPPRNDPAMVRAEKCGHWTAGRRAAWCLPCAVARRACSVCEASTE
jgi:hypothetical protein